MTENQHIVTWECDGCGGYHPTDAEAGDCCDSRGIDRYWRDDSLQSIRPENATLRQLVVSLGPAVEDGMRPDGSNAVSVLAEMAVLGEIQSRDAEREAAEIAVDVWPELAEELDGDIEDWLFGVDDE